MNSRIEEIDKIMKKHPNSFFIFSNGLTSREASYFYPENRCFYLLHGMGEALSIGVGLAKALNNIDVVVVDGDGNSMMGMASWSLMPIENLHYYVLLNGVHETTGGQSLQPFSFVPDWCNVINIRIGKEITPNPPSPHKIIANCQKWLDDKIK